MTDQILQFMEENCIVGTPETVLMVDLYRHYLKWCTKQRRFPYGNGSFAKLLKDRGFRQIPTMRGWRWLGLCIKPEGEK